VAAEAGPAAAASAPPVSAAALTTPMSAFRILVDVRMQYSFRHAAAVVLAAPVLNLRSASHGFLYLAAEGPAGFLWVRTHFCSYAGIAVTSLAVVDRSAAPHGRGGAGGRYYAGKDLDRIRDGIATARSVK
jgi:hypothetical protein